MAPRPRCPCPRCTIVNQASISEESSQVIHNILDAFGYRGCRAISARTKPNWWDWPRLVLMQGMPAHWLN